MGSDVASLGIKVDSRGVVKADKALNKLEKQSVRNEKGNKQLGKSFGLLKAAAVGVASSLVIKHFLSTAAAFETMKVSLETVTGSAQKAQIAFDGIKEFAQNTPFSVEEITQSFIKLSALGIEPTEANLRSFGNTSSAMGKSLNQMIEAVADAATGEFERLKEFGIKSKSEGDNVSFTFRGVTTTVKKSAKDITGYLESIGTNEFGGAMAIQMDTLNGAMSNAGDAIDNLADKMGEGGLTKIAKGLTLTFANLVNNIADLFDENREARYLERQIEGITERIFLLQEGIESAQDNNWLEDMFGASVSSSTRQIAELNKELDVLNSKLAAVAPPEDINKIDQAGAGDDKRQTEIDAEKAKNQTLLETAAEFQLLHKAQAIQAKEIENEQLSELQRIADEQMIVSQYTLAAQAEAQAQQDAQMRGEVLASSLGYMSTLTASSSKRLFQLGKSMSIASALVNTYQAVTKTMANTPYPFNIPLAAAQGVAGMVQVQNIKSQSFSGQAHEGMDYVKNTGSYQLEKGEMVVDKGTSDKVRNGLGANQGPAITFAPVVQAFDAQDVMDNNDKLFNGMLNRFIAWKNEEGYAL